MHLILLGTFLLLVFDGLQDFFANCTCDDGIVFTNLKIKLRKNL